MSKQKLQNEIFVIRSFVNSFHYLYGDAEYFHGVAKSDPMKDTFEQTRLCRTALLLYILSLEALINRSLDQFLPEPPREFMLAREERLSMEDKWELLPLLASSSKGTFVKSGYPWSHFAELVRLRNDFVHPKHDRAAYYRFIASHELKPLDWKKIPPSLGVPESDVIYRQTLIPKDPYAIKLTHVDTAKRVVDDLVKELDKLLDGRITSENWYRTDQMELVHPPGKTFADVAGKVPQSRRTQ